MLIIRLYYGADVFMEVVRMSMFCKRRLLFLEAVRIGEAHHVYSWGNPDDGNPDDNVPHVTMRCVPRVFQREGSLHCPPF